MPYGASSRAVVRVKASIPPFDASYAAMPRWARVAPPLETLTMAPPPWWAMIRAARSVHRYWLFRFTRRKRSHHSSSPSKK